MRLNKYLTENKVIVHVKKPRMCTNKEQDRFVELVQSGGQNIGESYIRNSFNDLVWVALLYVDGEVKAVSSIKKGKIDPFENADVKKLYRKYPYEVGFSFTDPDSRGKGYNMMLKDELFKKVGNKGLYCTIRISNVASISVNTKLGFKQVGDTWQGLVEPLQLMVK